MPIIDVKSNSRVSRSGGNRRSGTLHPGPERIWDALLDCVALRRNGGLEGVEALAHDAAGRLTGIDVPSPEALFFCDRSSHWVPTAQLRGEALALADLYLAVCTAQPATPYVVGHLGQSLDGYIATQSGDSDYVTGPENIVHLHRMRALCDAVVVGAGTVESDDPELTVRLVPGRNPTRIVLDPSRRLAAHYKLFSDDKAPTWLVCAEGRASPASRHGNARVVAVPVRDGRLDLANLLERLERDGLGTLFVEGGGETVSSFLDAGLLDRLQIAVALLVTGRGRPGLRTRARQSLADCLRPPGRAFRMGRDILFDCDLRPRDDDSAPGPEQPGLERLY